MLSTPGRALVDLRFSGTSPGCSPRFVLFLFVPSVPPSVVSAVSNLYRRCGTPPATGQIIHYEARACTRHVAHGESRAREMGERCGGRPTARRHPSLREGEMYGSALDLSSKACVSRLVLEQARRSKSGNNARGPSTPAEFPDADVSCRVKNLCRGLQTWTIPSPLTRQQLLRLASRKFFLKSSAGPPAYVKP